MIWSWHSTKPASSTSTAWSSFAVRIMNVKATAGACLMLGCGVLHGCIVLPVPVPRSSGPAANSRAEISKSLPEQIVAGETTRREVLLLLGEPDGRGDKDRWFTFGSTVGRGGIGWSLFYAVGGGYGGTAGATKMGDWETVRRATIRFDDDGIASKVDFEEKNCTTERDAIGNQKCPDAGGREILSNEIVQRLAAQRAAQLELAGTVLSSYATFQWIAQNGSDCRAMNLVSREHGWGHDLLIAEHAILGVADLRDGKSNRPGGPNWVLTYDEIAEVRPLEQHLLRDWIPIRTRTDACVYLRFLKPRQEGSTLSDARSLILAHLTPGAVTTVRSRFTPTWPQKIIITKDAKQ
jgi:hypothetical protein